MVGRWKHEARQTARTGGKGGGTSGAERPDKRRSGREGAGKEIENRGDSLKS